MQPQSDRGALESAGRDPASGEHHVLERIEREIAVLVRAATRIPELHTCGRTLHLSTSSYVLLARLHECEPRRASELARDLGLDKSTMSRNIAALEREGLVERVGDPADGRAALLRLSEVGRRSFGEMRDARRQVLRERLSGWSEQDRREFGRLLGQLNTDLGLTMPDRSSRGNDTARPQGA